MKSTGEANMPQSAEPWAIPYTDQEHPFWEEISARFGPRIQEVYFPIRADVAATGRGPQPTEKLQDFLKRSMAFGETYAIRGVGVGGGGVVSVPENLLQDAEKLARTLVKA